jgi:5-methylcytosine-specific restriction enzyme subunit McrC
LKPLLAKDLSRLEKRPSREVEDWLEKLAEHVSAGDHVVSLGAASGDPEPIVSRAYDGHWRAGRYVGSISFRGRRLTIEPRLAPAAFQKLVSTALNVVIATRSGALERSSTIVPLLLAMVWTRELDTATRHGLPHLRAPVRHQGMYARGRLEQRGTMDLRRRGVLALASTDDRRSLDNDVVRTLVCGHRALVAAIGNDTWMTRRARDVMPHFWSVAGTRPELPSAIALRKIRYSPIRLPYRPLVAHSWAIARGRGLRGAGEGEAEGLLLDMAELWEQYVFRCVERATEPPMEATHDALGDGPDQYLYRSLADEGRAMGLLLPDVVVRRKGRPVAIVDAKYKLVANRPDARRGVTREDRYQLAGYLTSCDEPGVQGVLIYPAELDANGTEVPPDMRKVSSAEADGPWRGPGLTKACFKRISFNPNRAVMQLKAAISPTVDHAGSLGRWL